MNTEWRELESDPGLFTLLIRDFGVKGVEVEEIYDLEQEIEGSVYGFIFLANWMDDGNWRRRNAGRDVCAESGTFVEEAETVNNMFFAHQVVTNACATYALLNVLLNCPNVELGSLLGGVKEFTEGFDPESKGYAIANLPQLKTIHNRHSRPVYPQLNLPVTLKRKRRISIDRTAFHYSSYLPLNGCLMELDGLKVAPVNHGPVMEGDGWIAEFKSVILRRIEVESGLQNSIHFNLLAVKPERLISLERRLLELKDEWKSMAGKIEDVLGMLPYKPVSICDDHSLVVCNSEEDDHLSVGSFSQRLRALLQVHHPSEFPHVFACATPCPNTDISEEEVEYKYPGYTELAPLHSFVPWLEVLHAHNVRVSYSAKAFMAAEMSESQLIEMTSSSTSTCDADDRESKEKGCNMDIMFNCGGNHDGGDDDSSSDATIIDSQSDSETVDCEDEDASLCWGRRSPCIVGCEQDCGATSFDLANGDLGHAPGTDLEFSTGSASVSCDSSSVASADVFPNELSDAQFEATCEQLAKLEQEIEQLQKLIKDENEKHALYNADFHRRTQDYQPFIEEYLKMVCSTGLLQEEPNFHKALQQQQAAKAAAHGRRNSSSSRHHKPKRSCKVWSTTIPSAIDEDNPSNEDESSNGSELNSTDY